MIVTIYSVFKDLYLLHNLESWIQYVFVVLVNSLEMDECCEYVNVEYSRLFITQVQDSKDIFFQYL